MRQYKELIQNILDNGIEMTDRTGVGTLALDCQMIKFDLSKGFPIVTGKRTFFKGAIHELLFFLKGGNNIKDMDTSIQHWWKPFTNSTGDLGSATYGNSLREFQYGGGDCEGYSYNETSDQLHHLIRGIQDNPQSRRHIITSWHPAMVENQNYLLPSCYEQANYLPPCHLNMVQFFVRGDKLNMSVYCRSQDVFLGTPVNWVEHSALLHIIANITGYRVGTYTWIGGDVHLYKNHIEAAKKYLESETHSLPQLKLKRQFTEKDIYLYGFNINIDDFELINYQYSPSIKAEMAI